MLSERNGLQLDLNPEIGYPQKCWAELKKTYGDLSAVEEVRCRIFTPIHVVLYASCFACFDRRLLVQSLQ